MPIEKFQTRLGSAHVMGGCAMGDDPARAVVDTNGHHMNLARLSVMDGSLFPDQYRCQSPALHLWHRGATGVHAGGRAQAVARRDKRAAFARKSRLVSAAWCRRLLLCGLVVQD
jgi:hypothetical protein